MAWPKQSPSAMNQYFGNPDANGDGAPDPKWEAANLTSIKPPYRMVLAWDPAKPVKSIRVHKACAESLLRALEAILAHYGSQAAIEQARMHLYGGCYNFRLKRGGSTLSIHSWGAAIDLDPERNGFGVKWRDGRGMMPLAVVRIFEAEGWEWGGLWGTADAMHFQAAKTSRPGPRIAPAARKAPAPATRARPAADPLVEAIQRELVRLGYPEVGAVDGRPGTKTRGAILAFEADNGLPLTGVAGSELLTQLLAARPRTIAPERAAATPAEVRERVPEAQASFLAKAAGLAGVAISAVTGLIGWLAESVGDIRELVRPLLEALGDVPWWTYLLLFGAGALWLWLTGRKGETAAIDAFREGARQ